jgi:hypothetical protein
MTHRLLSGMIGLILLLLRGESGVPDTKAAQDRKAENVEIARSKARATKYIENWQAHARQGGAVEQCHSRVNTLSASVFVQGCVPGPISLAD